MSQGTGDHEGHQTAPVAQKVIRYPTDRQYDAAATHTVVLGYKAQRTKAFVEDSKGSQQ